MKPQNSPRWLSLGVPALLVGGALAAVYLATPAATAPANSSARPNPFLAAKTLPQTPMKAPAGKELATFAAGCFWSMEAIFKQLKGVEKVEPGYAGGWVKNPSYEQVETSTTGHAETASITFDPKVISYRELLQVLLTVRNPTTPNQQGPDEGPQYRFVIFTHDAAQKQTAEKALQEVTAAKIWSRPLAVKIESFSNFYRAEDYHLDYYNLHPDQGYCASVIKPEIDEFHEKFGDKLK